MSRGGRSETFASAIRPENMRTQSVSLVEMLLEVLSPVRCTSRSSDRRPRWTTASGGRSPSRFTYVTTTWSARAGAMDNPEVEACHSRCLERWARHHGAARGSLRMRAVEAHCLSRRADVGEGLARRARTHSTRGLDRTRSRAANRAAEPPTEFGPQQVVRPALVPEMTLDQRPRGRELRAEAFAFAPVRVRRRQ